MEILEFYPDGTKKPKSFMVRVSKLEALKLIESITCQLVDNENNIRRGEFYDDKGQYFSISVHPNLKNKPWKQEDKSYEYNPVAEQDIL